MRFPDQHLSADEIELLAGEGDLSDELRNGLNQAREHIAVCEDCRQIVSAYRDMGGTMAILRNPGGAHKHPDCPPLDVWLQVAGGSLTLDENRKYLDHAAQCDYCGPIFAEVLKDFEAPGTEKENSELDHLAKLPLTMLKPQKSNSRAKADIHVEELNRSRYRNLLIWCCSTAALVLILIVGVAFFRRSQVSDVENVRLLLAQSYSEHRNLELRMPDAAFSQWTGRRGKGDESDHPPELDEANYKIKKAILRHPEDSTWLQLKGRAAILSWEYDKAIKVLDDALSLSPNDPALLIDHATALFERGEHRGDKGKSDFAQAANDLEKALESNPKNPVALFNLAIMYEKLECRHVAIDRWKKYLVVDSTSAWASEAFSRLKDLEKTTSDHDQRCMKPLSSARSFPEAIHSDPIPHKARTEKYQQIALTEWLPSAFSMWRASSKKKQYYAAVRHLALLLKAEHDDPWMRDLLAARPSPTFAAGLEFLRKALLETETGDPEGAYQQSKRALMMFQRVRNTSAVLRSRVELVHALQRMQHGSECLKNSTRLYLMLSGTQYHWLKIQLQIDQAACALELGQFDLARSYIAGALSEAHSAKYTTLSMRALGIAAAIETDEGNIDSAWQLDSKGLEQFWQAQISDPMRAHQFYDDLTYVAEDSSLSFVAVALAQESMNSISLTTEISGQALSLQHLAQLEFKIGDKRQAFLQLKKSLDLLSRLDEWDAARIDGEINLAEIEKEQGEFNEAEIQLRYIRGHLARISSFRMFLKFYVVSSGVLEAQDKLTEAEGVLQEAIDLGDRNLKYIASFRDRQIWNEEMSPIYRTLTALELRKKNSLRAYAIWEWYLAAPVRQQSVNLTQFYPFNPNYKISSLYLKSKNKILITYSVLPHHIAIWITSSMAINYRSVDVDTENLDSSIRAFQHLCADPQSDFDMVKLQSTSLYKLFIAPIDDILSNVETVVFEPDEKLGSFPFQALMDSNSRFLIERFAIMFSYGHFFQFLPHPPPAIDISLEALVVASTANFPGQPSTPYIEAEADMVAKIFPKHIELVGSRASVASLRAEASKAEVIHYVGHAVSDIEQEGLVLRTSGSDSTPILWRSDEVSKIVVRRCRLAVLSACSTGRHGSPRMEPNGELSYFLILAGVPNIVASAWDVESKTSLLLMQDFYSSLKSGQALSVALAVSCRKILNQENTRHPYHWAAFRILSIKI
jgi:CHAT domain-containing protein